MRLYPRLGPLNGRRCLHIPRPSALVALVLPFEAEWLITCLITYAPKHFEAFAQAR